MPRQNCQQKVGIGGEGLFAPVPRDFFAITVDSFSVSFIIPLLFTNLEISANRRQRWPLVLRYTRDKKCDR